MSSKAVKKDKKYEIDMCNGPLLGKILVYALPLMLSGILQLLFNAADIVVVGRFAGNEALAAVGSTGSLINLLLNVFIGLSVGTNVLVSRFYGAGQPKELSEMVHTAIMTAFIGGCALIILGFALAAPALRLMGTPEDVIDLSVLYMRIYFLGMPATMLYNFGAAILRAVGDTKRPLYFLMIAGVINVVLNLFFVIIFHMSVAGVALATAISQVVSAILVIRCLMKTDAVYKLELKKLQIKKDKLIKMINIGIPAGVQGALFSVSNVLIQSSINGFGSVVMAGNTAAANLEGFVYTAMNAFYQTAVSFTGQNYGAQKYKRIGRIAIICIGCAVTTGIILGSVVVIFGEKLLLLYSTDPEVIKYGILRLTIICSLYFLCGIMDSIVGSLRGMGYSVMTMLVSLTGACAFRVVWIYTIFKSISTLECLYISYPISWALTSAVHITCFFIVYRKLLKKHA